MIRATSRRITGTVVIPCHLFLGATTEPTATLTVDRGIIAAIANRICTLPSATLVENFMPNFPVATELDSEGGQEKSTITCVAATAGATIFYSE